MTMYLSALKSTKQDSQLSHCCALRPTFWNFSLSLKTVVAGPDSRHTPPAKHTAKERFSPTSTFWHSALPTADQKAYPPARLPEFHHSTHIM